MIWFSNTSYNVKMDSFSSVLFPNSLHSLLTLYVSPKYIICQFLEGAKEARQLHNFSNAICKKQQQRVCFMMLCRKNVTKDKHRVSSSLLLCGVPFVYLSYKIQ